MFGKFAVVRGVGKAAQNSCCSDVSLQDRNGTTLRSFAFWSTWKSPKRKQPNEARPQLPKHPAERSAYGARWTDEFRWSFDCAARRQTHAVRSYSNTGFACSWMESNDKAFAVHLEAEHQYIFKHTKLINKSLSSLRKEMVARLERSTVSILTVLEY